MLNIDKILTKFYNTKKETGEKIMKKIPKMVKKKNQATTKPSVTNIILENGMNILRGYVSSLYEIAGFPEVDQKLELNYESVKNLPVIIAYEFLTGMNSGEAVEKNIEIAEKSIASYLYLLASNQHNIGLKMDFKGDFDAPGTFSGIKVTASEINFLEAAKGSVKYEDDKITIIVSNVCKAYETTTGVNLREHGLDDAELVLKHTN